MEWGRIWHIRSELCLRYISTFINVQKFSFTSEDAFYTLDYQLDIPSDLCAGVHENIYPLYAGS